MGDIDLSVYSPRRPRRSSARFAGMDINADSARADFETAAPSAHPLTIAQARTEWDVQTAFLDSCSYGPPPRRGWEAMQRSLDQ